MSKKYYEFEVELTGSKPRIWRRFYLRTSESFEALHDAILEAFEWGGHHLYEFREEGRRGEELCGHEAMVEEGIASASGFKLKRFFGDSPGALKAKGCSYMYDFGDGWEHKVKLKRVVELDEVFTRRLLAGASASALDDCGGIWGYQQLLADAADGDEEAQEQLSCRSAEFLLEERREGFDVPRQRATTKTKRVEAAQPVVVAPVAAPALQPSQALREEVARLLMARLGEDAGLAGVIARAAGRWAELVERELPRRKPEVWAAALEYAATRELGEARGQGVIAQAYGVSAPAVSQTWPLVSALLDEPARPVEAPPAKAKPAPAAKTAESEAAKIEALLVKALRQDDVEEEEIERARAMCREFAAAAGPLRRRAPTYAAAMEYVVRLTSEAYRLRRTQAEIAQVHGVSEPTISTTSRQIAAVLEIDLESQRGSWGPDLGMLEEIRQMMAGLGAGLLGAAPRAALMWEEETLEALRGLRRDEEEEWELSVDVEDGQALCFWCSRQDAARLGVLLMEFEGMALGGEDLLAALAESWLSHPAQGLPGVLVCDSPDNLRLLSAAMEAVGVSMSVEPLTSVPRLHYSYMRADTIQASEQGAVQGVEDSALAQFYALAYQLWVVAPWRHAVEAQLIEARDKKHQRCLSVVGEQGDLYGLALCDSVSDWEKMQRQLSNQEEFKADFVLLEFVYGFALREEERARVDALELPVASLDAYPTLSRWTKSGFGEVRASDYALMSRVMEGLLAMLAERPQLFEERFDKQVTIAAGLTLIAPHSVARRRWAALGLLDHAWA